MANLNKKTYELEVWYRFMIGDNQEKDFDTHPVQANSLDEAIEEVKKLYNRSRAVFAIYHNKIKLNF